MAASIRLREDRSTDETFRLLAFAWNVTQGHELVADQEPIVIDITGVRSFLPLVQVDDNAVATANYIDYPILIATLPMGPFPIDGWHRIVKALQDGVTVLMGHVLTPTQERSIRIRGEFTK